MPDYEFTSTQEVLEDAQDTLSFVEPEEFYGLVLVCNPVEEDSDDNHVTVWTRQGMNEQQWAWLLGNVGYGIGLMKEIEEQEKAAQADRVYNAAKELINDVMRRYPGEEFRCPYMQELAAAVSERE